MTTPDEPWTIGRLLVWTVDYLKKHGADNPRLDAEVLLARARGCQRIDLYAAYGDEASDELRAKFREFVGRRAKGEPVAYIVGHKEFYALDFEVTLDVLIPRPETELLVVALLDHAKARREDAGPLTIGDVGTGSGVLAVCAAKYVPQAHVTAIDISPAALAVARRNAERHGVADRISFVESDLFAAVPENVRFDFVVSNPPYVSTAEMAELPADVRDYEPHMALEGGEHGTETIARLVTESAARLNSGGALLMEISPMIVGTVEALIREIPAYELGLTLKDSAGLARVIQARRKVI
jgi:release factor glutamine methyltransferase